MTVDTQTARRIERAGETLTRVRDEVARAVVGQGPMVDRLLIGLLTGGHVLLEGVPGVAKTLAATSLAQALSLKFRRIQFTPDLLPADLTGTLIYNPRDGSFSAKKGPVFANIVLADEINRAPAKVQSALLESMQEMQVTLGDETHKLEQPFLVLATQNPIEQEGTYPLPEAQLDRFMMKVRVSYPSKEEELKIVDRMAGSGAEPRVGKVLSPAEILAAREAVRQIFVDDKVKRYVVDLVAATRDPQAAKLPQLKSLIECGASVRASLNLIKVAKANALMSGRNYISPHDVKSIAHDVLRHRLLLSYEAEAENKTADDIVTTILENVAVP